MVNFKDIGPLPDSDAQFQHIPPSHSLIEDDEDNQANRLDQFAHSDRSIVEPSYQEHSSGFTSALPQNPAVHIPSLSPQTEPQQMSSPFSASQQQHPSSLIPQPWQPAVPHTANPASFYGYASTPPPVYAEYRGSWSPYTPYPYPVVLQPSKSRRNSYQSLIAILSITFSLLIITLGIIGSFILLALENTTSTLLSVESQFRFSATVISLVLTIIGLVGGICSFYHSIRALAQKQSVPFMLPWSWLFLLCYLLFLTVLSTVDRVPQVLADEPMKIVLILVASVLPAITFLAFVVRRIYYDRKTVYSTTWRRFTLAIVSGGTVAVLLALLFEVFFVQIIGNTFDVHISLIDNLSILMPQDTQQLFFITLLIAVIVPLIEESVKPLAVLAILGRLQSAAEAFVLGFACGIGFDLVETSGYISLSNARPWMDVALERSTAGLLHGFGAGMVALGWYYLSHRHSIKHRILIGISCIAYAAVQHALWNATLLCALLPAPIGPFLASGTITIGSYAMQGMMLLYMVESLLMLLCLLLVTERLRRLEGFVAIDNARLAYDAEIA